MKSSRLIQVFLVIVLVLTSLNYHTTPTYAASAYTAGKNVDRSFWFDTVNRLNQTAFTEHTISDYAFAIVAFERWAKYENTNAAWNPLATVWDTGNKTWTKFNSVGVKNYNTRAYGVQATTATVSTYNSANKYLWAIRKMLARKGFDETNIKNALNKHTGNGAYVPSLVKEWKALYNNWNSTAISWKANSSFVLDVRSGSRLQGELIQLWKNGNGLNQKWQIKKLSDGTYNIISLKSGKCLDLKGGNLNNHATLQQWDCVSGNTNQKWHIERVGGVLTKYYLIRSAKSGKCIDVDGGVAINGRKIQQYTCDKKNKNQLWLLTLP